MNRFCILILVSLLPFGSMPVANASSDATKKPSSVPKYSIPVTGTPVPAFADMDDALIKYMQKWEVPGAAVAITQKGKLVYSRGFGYSNKEKKQAMDPAALFRVASVSKIITAVAALKLVQERKMKLETQAFPLLDLPVEADHTRRPEERVNQITIRHLLEGTAGWDRNAAGDPMFMPIAQQAAYEYSNSMRPTARAIIRYEACRRLDFVPGSRYSYSNLGYSILGEVIGKVSGQKYEQYVQDAILKPMGVKMIPGKTRQEAAGEVHYYAYNGEQQGPSICPNVRGYLPLEYGGDFYLEAMTADCGWVSSMIDIANFISCLFGEQGEQKKVLSDSALRAMIARPQRNDAQDKDDYTAMGWEIKDSKSPQDFRITKVGCLPGVHAAVAHTLDGTTFAIAFNSRPKMMTFFQDETTEFIKKQIKTHRKWLKQQG